VCAVNTVEQGGVVLPYSSQHMLYKCVADELKLSVDTGVVESCATPVFTQMSLGLSEMETSGTLAAQKH